jgi:ABC-2 type transport system permease protein
MLQTIFTYEWKQLKRSKGAFLSLIVFAIIGLFCLIQGKSLYQYQQVTIDSALTKKEQNRAFVQKIFDTLTYSTIERKSIEEPFVLERRLQDVVAKEQTPLSVLSVGQNDVYPPLLSGHFNNEIFKNNFSEFKNPEQLLAGNLDTAYFILFLFPVLLLSFTYNIQSADKEAGISSLLTIQSSSLVKLHFYKLLFRWLIALLPVVIIAIAAGLILQSMPSFSLWLFLQWWGIVLLYAVFWLLLVLLVQQFQFNSLINAISLAGLWVLLLIAIPGLLNTWFNYRYPVTNKTEIAEFRDYDFKAWDEPTEVHKKVLFSVYPKLQKDSMKLDSNKIRTFGYALQVLKKEIELHSVITKKATERALAEENSFWINPIGGVMRSFASLSKSSLQQQHQFEEAALKYREQKLGYIFNNYLLEQHFTKKDFEEMPKLISEKKDQPVFLYQITITMILMFLFILIRIRK